MTFDYAIIMIAGGIVGRVLITEVDNVIVNNSYRLIAIFKIKIHDQ